jgi:sugar O-acyltransferase (sialic acid O-acetyltransferase NeuD family)
MPSTAQFGNSATSADERRPGSRPGSCPGGRRGLVILGTGGNALDLLDAVTALNAQGAGWEMLGFLDDVMDRAERPYGLPILGRLQDACQLTAEGGVLARACFVNAIGSERNHARRAEILARTGLAAARFATLVHPAACVSPRAELGYGCFVGFAACVGGQVRAAGQAWIAARCVVGHDSVLGYASVLAPGAILSGHVRLGSCCYLGSGALVRQGVSVGDQALAGIGAVIIRDVAPRTVVVGNPARMLERSERSTVAPPGALSEEGI